MVLTILPPVSTTAYIDLTDSSDPNGDGDVAFMN